MAQVFKCYELLRHADGTVAMKVDLPINTIREADEESKARGVSHVQVYENCIIAEFKAEDIQFDCVEG